MAGVLPSAAGTLQNENLLVPMPKDFEVGYTAKQGKISLTEYVPRGESVKNWSRMITVNILFGAGRRSGDAFARDLAARWRATCPGGQGIKSKSGSENGYPFSLWVFGCPLNPQTKKPETMFLKTISGNDSFYDLQYAYRRAVTAEMVKPAVQYLSTVRACDTRLAARRCPPGM
jgi:hypothetical protein